MGPRNLYRVPIAAVLTRVHACLAGAMDEITAAYLHEEGLPYFSMFGQGSRPYTDLRGDHLLALGLILPTCVL